MKCRCCGKLIIDLDFLQHLNSARTKAGFPFIVNSGYRCGIHNAAVGSFSTNHTSGKAADIACYTADKRYKMLSAMIGAGMKGIGIGKTFIHCDVNRVTPALWIY